MQQKFPSSWKEAKILPLFKKGDILDRKNYRAVSILSPVSKILERVVHEQLYSYFSSNKILHPNVMGFRRNRSTMTAVLQMYDRWIQGAGKGKIRGIVFLHLSAAFDLVNPSLLVEKLKVYGLNQDFINWISCYLTNRKQAVWTDHTLSDGLDVLVGVPQGSILGPLLFLIFANDLPFLVSGSLDQYADDSTLSSVQSSILEINDELNSDCKNVADWMKSNQLCLNVDKTHLLVAGTSQKLQHVNRSGNVSVYMNGFQLSQSEEKSEKVLGVHLQSNLKWSKHCKELQVSLKSRLSGLRKIQNILSFDRRKVVAQAVFQSVLSYCIAVWGGAAKGDIENIQVIQNRAAQLTLNIRGWRISRQDLYNSLGWLTVHQLSAFHRILAVYNIRKSKEPEYLANLLSRDNVRNNIIIPHTGLSLLKRSFIFDGAELWNCVPHSIRQIECSRRFKHELRKWILTNVPRFQ